MASQLPEKVLTANTDLSLWGYVISKGKQQLWTEYIFLFLEALEG